MGEAEQSMQGLHKIALDYVADSMRAQAERDWAASWMEVLPPQTAPPSSPSSGSQAGVGKGRSGNRRISYRDGYRAGNMTAHRQWRTLLRAVQRSLTPEG